MDKGDPSNDGQTADTAQVPTRDFIQHIEKQAVQLRQRAGLQPMERFDPTKVAEDLKMTIATPDEIQAMPPALRDYIKSMSPKVWSGSGIPLPDGHLLVMLNPNQTNERAKVTTLEEASHEMLGHEPTKIDTLTRKRTYNARNEQEAYWTAAAALLPSKAVALAVYRGQSAQELAATFGVSVELAEFRIKITGLWDRYTRYAAKKGA
jgi:Zn-dependent peptidase ImmA (M78 family)